MIILLTKGILLLALYFVFIQDIKEREVYWFLFPVIGVCCSVLLIKNIVTELVLPTLLINISFIGFLIIVLFIYTKFILKTSLKTTFGSGDVFFFFVVAFSFSSVSFIILFVFALVCALVLHLISNKKSKFITVPLAGYMSLFFAISYVSHWLGFLPSLYQI